MSFTAARANMVESQVRTNDVPDARLQAAMRALPRERFCAPDQAVLAYSDVEVEIAEGRRLMTPRDLAKLLQALQPRPGETALVICEPYAAAVLARMGLEVTARDTDGVVAAVGDALGEEGVTVLSGQADEPPAGNVDVLVAGGSVAHVPPAWLEGLSLGGRAGVIVRSGPLGRAEVHLRSADGVSGRPIFECAPAWLPGLQPRPAFVF